MKRLSAAEAKNSFGQLIDLARHHPVLIEKHNRAVVVVISIEEYDRLSRSLPANSSEADARTGGGRAAE